MPLSFYELKDLYSVSPICSLKEFSGLTGSSIYLICFLSTVNYFVTDLFMCCIFLLLGLPLWNVRRNPVPKSSFQKNVSGGKELENKVGFGTFTAYSKTLIHGNADGILIQSYY